MMYLSRGALTQSAKTGLDYVSRCGCVYALGPELAGLWKNARFKPQLVPQDKELAIKRMESSGLVVATEEMGALAAYRLLTSCIICPNNRRWTDRLLSRPARRTWEWLNEAGMPDTAHSCTLR